MAASLYPPAYNDHDIDPNSTVLIRICIKSIAQTRTQPTLSTTKPDAAHHNTNSEEPRSGHTTHRGKAKNRHGDMTQGRVMSMSPNELVSLHKRVQQLELSNYGMLRRIYGDQVSAAPYVQFNGHDPASSTKTDVYRKRLFEHYQTMMEVARDPEMPDLEPASAEGARLLKTFQQEFARMTQTGSHSPRTSTLAKTHEHRLRSDQKQSRNAWRVDKKATQAHRARLEQFNTSSRGQSTALTDYQLQLMLLEEQNQERLAMMQAERQATAAPAFDPILYQAQLAALKVANHKRLEMRDMAQMEVDAGTNESVETDLDMSEGASPVDDATEGWRGRDRTVRLPTRDKR